MRPPPLCKSNRPGSGKRYRADPGGAVLRIGGQPVCFTHSPWPFGPFRPPIGLNAPWDISVPGLHNRTSRELPLAKSEVGEMNKTSEQSESRVSADRNLVARDSQQARVLGILARRAGELVTYDELRAAGIELPASLIAELELAGAEVDRVSGIAPDGRPVTGVRLASPAKEIAGLPAAGGSDANVATRPALAQHASPRAAVSASGAPPAASGWGAVRVYRGLLPSALAKRWSATAGRRDEVRVAPDQSLAGQRGSRTRLLAPLALLIGSAVTAALVIAAVRSGEHPSVVTAGAHPRATGSAQANVARPRVHSAHAHSKAHAARTSGPSQRSHVVASDAGQQPAPASSAAAPASTAETTSTPAPNSTPRAASSTAPAASSTAPVANVSSGQNQPQAAVQAFYEAAAHHRYATAWALADTNMRDEVGGYGAFVNQMSSVREISFHSADVLQRAPTWATIAVRTTSVQTTRTQQCWGTVRTINQSGAWLLDGISIHCS
jgi:hypothetical protein